MFNGWSKNYNTDVVLNYVCLLQKKEDIEMWKEKKFLHFMQTGKMSTLVVMLCIYGVTSGLII